MVFLVHYMPVSVLTFLQSGVMSIVVLLLILLILCRAPDVALFLALAYLVTMQVHNNRISEGLEMPKDVSGKDILSKNDGTFELKMSDNAIVHGKYDADMKKMHLVVMEGDKKDMKMEGKLDEKGRLVVKIEDKPHYVDDKGKLSPMVEGFADYTELELVSENPDGSFIAKTNDNQLVEVSKEASKYVNMKFKHFDEVFAKLKKEKMIPQSFELVEDVQSPLIQKNGKIFKAKDGNQDVIVIYENGTNMVIYYYGELKDLVDLAKNMNVKPENITETPERATKFLAEANEIPTDSKPVLTRLDKNGMETTYRSSKGNGKFQVGKNKELTVMTDKQETKPKKNNDMLNSVMGKLKEGNHIPADASVQSSKKVGDKKIQVVFCSADQNGAFVIDFEDENDVKVEMGEYDVSDMCKTSENFSMPVDFNAGLVDAGNFNYTSGCTGDCKYGLPLQGGPLDGPCNAVSTFNPSLNAQGINCPLGYDGPQIGALVE
jgi:translation initiation factor IF-1